MKRQRAWTVLGVLLLSVGGYDATFPKPPEHFVDRGACPGECCTYGTWRAERLTDLYEAPTAGARIVGQAELGSYVDALTGEVHTKAGKFVVRQASPPYSQGDVIWIYTYLGEGYYKVWRSGEIVPEEISVQPEHQNPDDWGYYEKAPDSHWWVKVKTKRGLAGWTNTPGSFSGTHSCG